MKRFLAVLAVLCLLLSMSPWVLAAPAEEPEADQEAALTEDGAEAPADGENPEGENADGETPAEAPAEEPEKLPAPETPDPREILSDVTAIQKLKTAVGVDAKGRAQVTQVVEVSVVGTQKELTFAVPADAKSPKVGGYRARSASQGNFRYLTVTNKDGFTGTQTFTITYSQSGVVSQTDKGLTLSLLLLSAQEYPTGTMELEVSLPQELPSKAKFSSGYHGSLIEDVMEFQTAGSAVSGRTTAILQDHEHLTMTLELPADYFAGDFGENSLGPAMTVVVLILAALTVLYWWQFLRNNSLRVQARTLPPDGVNPGDVPFLLAGGHADFNMLVSYWATLGYLTIYVSQSGNVHLRRQMSMGNERRPFERKLFDLLFDREDDVDGASLRYQKVGEKAMAVIPRYWAKRLYQKSSGSPVLARLLTVLVCALATMGAMDTLAPDKLHAMYLLAGLVAGGALSYLVHQAWAAYYLGDWVKTGVGFCCGFLLLLLGGLGGAALPMGTAVAVTVFTGWQTVHGGRRSPYGDEVIGQTLGFRRFLHNATDHHLQQMLRRDPQYFYKMLPYAQAMGQGKRFVGLFHGLQLEPCQWYESADRTPRTAAAFYADYCETLELLNVSIKK